MAENSAPHDVDVWPFWQAMDSGVDPSFVAWSRLATPLLRRGEQLADDYEELGGGRCAVM